MSYGDEPVLRSVASPIGQMDLLDGGVIRHALEPAAIVDAAAAAKVLRLTAELAADSRVAVVVDLRAIGFADDDAQSMFSTSDAGGVEVATALVAHVDRQISGQTVHQQDGACPSGEDLRIAPRGAGLGQGDGGRLSGPVRR